MEGLQTFLESDIASILGGVFLLVGISDIVINFLVFKKKLAGLEQQILSPMPTETLHPLESQIKGLRLIITTLQSTGALFIAGGLYLLVR